FSDELFDGGNPTSLAISSGAVSIAGTRTLSADRRKIVFQPDNPLPFSSTITTSAIYAANGLKSMQGNPIYRVVNFNFTTQASQTQPVSISQLNLFRDASYDPATVYSTNDDFLRSGNMYIEARGTDMSPNTIDVTMASIDTLGSLRLDETSVNSGIYRGIYNYSNLADGFSFNVSATVDPTVNQTLLLTIPKLTPQTPATGSSNVSIYTSIEVKASEDLASATVNSSNVKLFKDDVGGAEIVGTVSYRVSEKEIVFVPSSALATDTLYVYRVSNIKDLAGNTITSNLTVSFTTQAATIAPLPPIDYLKIYADNAYSNELSNLDSIQPGSQVFVEIKANDESTGTIDSTLVEQSSNSSANIQATLIETGLNTGIFKGSLTIFNEEGAQILITSLTDTTASLTLQTYFMPRIDKFKPTSGAENIVYLNQEFTITTTKNVNPLTLSTSTIQLSDSHGPASYTLSMLDSTTIKLSSELQPNSSIVLTITTDLKDTDGLAFPDTTASYTSITQQYTFFGTYKDADYANALTNDATVEVGQTIYLRLIGTDTRTIETEYATATLKSSLPDSEISLTESSAGSFTGSFIVPTLSNETISMIPESRNDLARTLKVLPPFTLLSFSPASGAIAVPADTWPTWNFSRPVRDSDVTAANFSLKRINGATTNVDGDLSISTTGLQVRFQPKTLMSLLTQYEMSVAATIEDTSGNLLGEAFKTNFTTQPPPLPPSENITLANYETSDYATKTLAVAKNDSLYLELVAKDTSFSTYETTRVRVDSSDGSLDGLELALTEIAPPSGIYHLAMPINLAPGVTITVQSQGNSAIKLTITAYDRTTLQIPASGSLNLFLDSPIQLNFSHSIDRNTVAAGISLLASDARPIELRFAYADSDRSISITPDVSYASATRHQLQISTNLRDTNGLFLLPDTTWLTTRSESSATFDLLTGIATRSGQNVSQIKEATPGQLVLVATTTNMFETYSETRNLQIQTASTTDIVALSESAPGSFQGEFNLPAATEGDITATLLFAHQPTLIFRLAPLPEVVSLDPASGSSDVAELPVISATFSRKLAVESTADALRIVTEQGNIITQATNPAVDSNSFSWRPLSPLPLQSTCTLQLEDITDYLGQTLTPYRHNFTTGGRQGITIFSDNNFAQLIATDQIEIPLIFVEVAASGTTGLSGQIFDLYARAGTRASTTVKLQLEPFSNESGRFRCSLEFEPGKAVPQYPLSLLPGEWLELTSPQLTDDRKILYYRHSGSAPPVSILGIKLFSEKHFAQLATDYIANPSLFIEVEAEDLNWFTTDTTKVRVYSDADQTGMVLDMIENGTHSSQFRNFIKLTRDNTDLTTQNLKTLPDQRVYIESVTDPAVRTSITYLPENTIKMMAVYPSPARGSNVNFRFYLNFPTYVDLKIYDTSGHEIFSTGIRGQEGENVYEWRFPRKTANGTYFYAIKIDNESGFPDAKRRVRGKFAILR
ncbi:MAG: Ig-like domain-containing protein, partial [Candidatus Riflebacteria bacterium]|nr:Ig-like domain-containing protein [Candidatus Riflebacteria bacterium]